MTDLQFVTTESLDEGRVLRVMLNRPDQRNAQNYGLLRDLNSALLGAEADDNVRVVILGGMGPMFSAGHDLSAANREDRRAIDGSKIGGEARWRREWDYYLTFTQRWRDLRKITIAQVHGYCLAAGLMLAWCCDLIVAAEDAVFADVVGTRLGMCGLEFFAHPWEFGARKAKELLLTGDSIDAGEAHRLGMVSKIFAPGRLAEDTLAFASRIARLPTATSLLIKESVNQTQDIQGFYNALRASFSLHQMNHSHWAEVTHGESILGTPEFGIPDWRSAPPIRKNDRSGT